MYNLFSVCIGPLVYIVHANDVQHTNLHERNASMGLKQRPPLFRDGECGGHVCGGAHHHVLTLLPSPMS